MNPLEILRLTPKSNFLDLESLVFAAERLADRMGALLDPPERDSPFAAMG